MQNMAETRVTSLATDLGFPKTDVTLVVEDQKIHVNKAVLSEHSPVFNAMFNSEFKESTAVEITLEGKRAADVAEFLKCFYPNMKHNITGILNCLYLNCFPRKSFDTYMSEKHVCIQR